MLDMKIQQYRLDIMHSIVVHNVLENRNVQQLVYYLAKSVSSKDEYTLKLHSDIRHV